jgi:ATP diphosphatase
LTTDEAKKTLAELLAVMAALRTPLTGCPWDLAQDFRTIAPYTIEEAYEVADAIERGNLEDLKTELGDLLLQVVYHARMAEEKKAFDFTDVVDAVTRKMIRRHPHVFGTPEERATGAAPGFWQRLKDQEKASQAPSSAGAAMPPASLLADVPVTLPALTRAVKLQEKAANVGFDWPTLGAVFDKLGEELAELEAEIKLDRDEPPAPGKVEEEFGDVLLAMANLARHLKVDPEAALRVANQKFVRRFRYVEEALARLGKSPVQSDLAEMDGLWNEAKRGERR